MNRKGRTEFPVTASYQDGPRAPDCYKRRRRTEPMFKAFKSAGFDLEDSHLADHGGVDKPPVFVALAY